VSKQALIDHVMDQRRFAVTGVSRDPEKYGYKVYRALKLAGYTVFAVNPNAETIDDEPCYPTLDNVPGPLDCVVTVTPPQITEETIRTAAHLKIPYIWMQPGSDSNAAYNLASSLSLQVVAGGACILVALALRREHSGATV
jgi:predicted CoA-binding protein